MRRMWAAGAAIVLCLALGGIPVVAQSPSPAPARLALVTGTMDCFSMGTYTETSQNGATHGHLPDVSCSTRMSDPRVSGQVRLDLDGACYPTWGARARSRTI
jgi:hypothetical protein